MKRIWCNNQQSKFTKTALATKKARFRTTDWRALSKRAKSSKKTGPKTGGNNMGKEVPQGKMQDTTLNTTPQLTPNAKKNHGGEIGEEKKGIEDNMIYYVYE